MKTWARKTLAVGVLAAGALLFGPAAAHADAGHHGNQGHSAPTQAIGMNNGILNGTQLTAPVSVPVNVVGNSLGVAGVANSVGAGSNRVESGWGGGQVIGANNGIANGTQAYLPISVPVNVVGNSLAVLGGASSQGVGVNSVGAHGRKAESAQVTEGHWGPGGDQFIGQNNGIGNGTQIYSPIDIPVNVCGNSIALLGGASAGALCSNTIGDGFGGVDGNWGGNRRHGHHGESAQVTEGGHGPVQAIGANNGILNGTQLYAPISLPVNLAGNSVALLGEANSRAVAGNKVESAQGGWGGQAIGQNNGILNGTQIAAPISVPINVCGNALGILGGAQAVAGCSNSIGGDFGDDSWGHGHGGPVLGGDHGHHGNGGHGHGNGNAGDNGNNDGDYKGDHGNKGDGGAKPAGNDDNGYGGTEPATNDDKGYGGTAPATNGSDTKSHGGRGKESTPVTSLTSSVSSATDNSGLGGLGLLNTLR